MWEDYGRRVEAACGESQDVLVTFQPQTRDEALTKVCTKCHLDPTRSGVVTKGHDQTKDVSIFRTGTLLIQEFQGRAKAVRFLEALFA